MVKLQDKEGKFLARNKNHFVTMDQEDIDRLKPGQWLNDCVIDFWMMWITRKEPADENWVHTFNMQFYTSLIEKGVDHVLKWIQKRNLDVFSKTMLILPINKQLHCSLCCIFNPRAVMSSNDEEHPDMEMCFLLFLDPLDYHSRVQVCQEIREWLNAAWNRKHNTNTRMFTHLTTPWFTPEGKQCYKLYNGNPLLL